MPLPSDYTERVYAGILGKIIGVYLGRPVEGWTYEKITARFGEITRYVNEDLSLPLVVTDDDIAGTFTFLRALPDYGNSRQLTSAQIGQTWLNYLVENQAILWWGGMGCSTEHTAYLRLKNGIPAPRSGSMELNGKTISEQIGAQIFVDGWAMVAPGDPGLAVRLAGEAARVSHDGEAVIAAQLLAAMESLAFIESNLNEILDASLKFIPADSLVNRVVDDIRGWHTAEPDWRKAREKLAERYGYHRYPGVCHVIPNHALIHLALLYGGDDFARSQRIVNTCGWDTDCNAGNVGCFLGIKNGLKSFEGELDWRSPVADRMYLSSADGGRAISDAAQETIRLVNIGRALAGEQSLSPKKGARFHFELPGSVQGFRSENKAVSILNEEQHSAAGERSLEITLHPGNAIDAQAIITDTFIPPEAIRETWYPFIASPSLYPGQVLRAGISADAGNSESISCGLFIRHYDGIDGLETLRAPRVELAPGENQGLIWTVPDCSGQPVAAAGLEFQSSSPTDQKLYLDYLSWEGEPEVVLKRPSEGGSMWRRAWVRAVDQWSEFWEIAYRLVQNIGTGMIIQGSREWQDIKVEAAIKPHLVEEAGVAIRVQGLKRYYALLLQRPGKILLIKELDGRTILAEKAFPWEEEREYPMRLQAMGNRLQAWMGEELIFDVEDIEFPLVSGAIGLVVNEGCVSCEAVIIQPVKNE